MGSTLDDLSAFPADVKRAFGFVLREVQKGLTPPNAKPLSQFGPGVYELRDRYRGDAYRVVYGVRLAKAVYVLHAFKKKSKSGIGIPREDVNKISFRLQAASDIERLSDSASGR
jgi:phage-related protein